MTRAYIRLDPSFDERKESYPDGPYAALVATLCLSEHQPERGRFRSLDYLSRLLGKRGKHVRFLLSHGDILELPDGRVYVDGWDEWQEGDWKVAERVARIRSRPKHTLPVTPPVTVGVTLHPTKAAETDRLDSAGNGGGGDEAVAEQPAHPDPWDAPETEALAWLAGAGCDIRPGNGYHRALITMVEVYGVNAVIGMFDRLKGGGMARGDTKGFVFGAKDALDARTRPSLVAMQKSDANQRADDTAARRAENTLRLNHSNGMHLDAHPRCPICKEGAA